ncbi:MAG TPA: UDP-N-acetylmuramate dehydrogenase [Candidatus Paceibacterota bacterium]
MKILENISLKELTTFKTGGRARFFCVAKNILEIVTAIDFARLRKQPLFVLGGGSNILVSSAGFSGLVLKIDILGVEFIEKTGAKVEVIAGTGENWDNLVNLTVAKNLHGLENLSLIPGSVGSAPVQNIGAYGAEISSVISFVEVFDQKTLKLKILKNKDCRFSYRDSVFKTKAGKKFIITRVGFLLKKANKKIMFKTAYPDLQEWLKKEKISHPTVSEIRRAIVSIRTNKLPDLNQFGTAGSFFKNPIIDNIQFQKLKVKFPDLPGVSVNKNKVKIFLAWVLDKICDLKGFSIGKVGLHEKQPLVIVNYGGATAEEIKSFAKKIADIVKEEIGLEIEREVEYVG